MTCVQQAISVTTQSILPWSTVPHSVRKVTTVRLAPSIAQSSSVLLEHLTMLLVSLLVDYYCLFIVATSRRSQQGPPGRRLVVTGDSARIQAETTENSAWFFNVLGV